MNRRIDSSKKVTITLGQLKKLVRESWYCDGKGVKVGQSALDGGTHLLIPVWNIEWDTDGEDPEELELPYNTKVEVEIFPEDDTGTVADSISDELSDEYGWTVNNFDFDRDEVYSVLEKVFADGH